MPCSIYFYSSLSSIFYLRKLTFNVLILWILCYKFEDDAHIFKHALKSVYTIPIISHRPLLSQAYHYHLVLERLNPRHMIRANDSSQPEVAHPRPHPTFITNIMPRRGPPPRLRTKTGCFRCRLRRKKCDEIRPRCAGCRRQDFACLYPEKPEIDAEVHSRKTAQDCITLHRSSKSLQELEATRSWASVFVKQPTDFTFANEDWLLYHFQNEFTPLLIRPYAHPIYQDSSYLCNLQYAASWVRSAFLANSALHASCKIPYLKSSAMVHYSDAVHGLQRAIDDGAVDGSEDCTLAAVVFLLLFEVCSALFSTPTVQLLGLTRQSENPC